MAVSRINEAGLNVNQYGNRNLVINGAMMLSQRQTSSSNVSNKYVLDRFYVYKQNTSSTYTCSQASVTDLAGFNNSLKMECTTADTSLAANEEGYIQYKMEGQDLQGFEKGFSSAKGFALSFYVKTNKTGLYTVRLFDRDNSRNVSGSYTVSNTDWNRYTVLFPADTTGKFDDDNASSLELFFKLFAGSDTNTGTLQTTWAASGDANAATGQVNFADSTSNVWEVTGVQIETGDTATDFEHRSFADELIKCERYLQKRGTDTSGWEFLADAGQLVSATAFQVAVRFRQKMRAAPTFSYTGNLSDIYMVRASAIHAISSVNMTDNTNGNTVLLTGAVANTSGSAGEQTRMQTQAAGTNFFFDAEL
jgi:hypothetical protein